MFSSLLKKSKLISLSEKILFIFFVVNILNLINIISISFGKLIIYEDSFSLFNIYNNKFIYWLFEPHNGHIITLSKFITSFFKAISISSTGYNIFLSILILFSGLFIIKRTIFIINPESQYKNLIFLLCSFFWISPFQWENLIWEFQLPWFLIVFFVITLNYINFYNFKNKNSADTLAETIFLSVSPFLAILSSGQGICYLNCVLITLLIRKKFNLIPTICTIGSYLIFILIKIYYPSNIEIYLNFWNIISYFFITFFSIFKAPISAFNNFSYGSWIIPIISSIIFQLYLFIFIKKTFISKLKFKLNQLNLFIPLIFGIQFIILTSITRSQYGIYQGVVSRYSTCINLIPLGLIFLYHFSNNKEFLKNQTSKKFSLSGNYFQLSLVTLICLIINTSAIFKTISETPITLKTRISNFNIFKETCSDNIKSNLSLVKSNYSKLKLYPGANFPPLPDANNFSNFQKYLNSNICEATNELK